MVGGFDPLCSTIAVHGFTFDSGSAKHHELPVAVHHDPAVRVDHELHQLGHATIRDAHTVENVHGRGLV
jgi:hypothetical protein